jgi:hypothetical protein
MVTAYRGGEPEPLVLKRKSRGLAETFTLTEASLVYEWQNQDNFGRVNYALSDLSPELGLASGKASAPAGYLARGLFAIGMAIVFLASDVQEHVPLLAPFLFFVGTLHLGIHMRSRQSSTNTIIKRKNGEIARYVSHTGCDTKELAAFEAALTARIQAAKSLAVG